MNKSLRIILTGSIGAAALVVVLPTSPASAQSAALEVASSAQESGAVPEGIKVHGHWVIEVRDPDGTLTTRRAIENSLSKGSVVLAGLLSRAYSMGNWSLHLDGDDCPGNWCYTIQEIARGGTMSVEFLNEEDVDGKTLLSGSTTATGDHSLNSVSTHYFVCWMDMTPEVCGNDGPGILNGDFSVASLSPPVPVQAGQQIQVTVTISFE